MSINLIKIYEICRDENSLIDQIQNWGLIPRHLSCPKCLKPMSLINCARDGWTWKCNKNVSIRKQAAKYCNKRFQ